MVHLFTFGCIQNSTQSAHLLLLLKHLLQRSRQHDDALLHQNLQHADVTQRQLLAFGPSNLVCKIVHVLQSSSPYVLSDTCITGTLCFVMPVAKRRAIGWITQKECSSTFVEQDMQYASFSITVCVICMGKARLNPRLKTVDVPGPKCSIILVLFNFNKNSLY